MRMVFESNDEKNNCFILLYLFCYYTLFPTLFEISIHAMKILFLVESKKRV